MSGIPIQISKVKNSDGSFGVSVPPGENYTLADIVLTEPNGSLTTFPAAKNIAATQIGVLSEQDLEDKLIGSQRNALGGISQIQTGQTTSYNADDDGALLHGRLTDFFTLKKENSFGNTFRFTDEIGSQAFASNYAIDHATGYGWCTVLQTGENWVSTLSAAASFSLSTGIGTLNNFFVPNANEALSIARWDYVCLNYVPFNLNPVSSAQIWTSTTNYSNTPFAFRMSYQTFPAISTVAKTATQPALFCRIHNTLI